MPSQPYRPTVIAVAAEYAEDAYVWDHSPGQHGAGLDPALLPTLGASQGLLRRLSAWNDTYGQLATTDFQWRAAQSEADWRQEGLQLSLELQRQLPDIEVHYGAPDGSTPSLREQLTTQSPTATTARNDATRLPTTYRDETAATTPAARVAAESPPPASTQFSHTPAEPGLRPAGQDRPPLQHWRLQVDGQDFAVAQRAGSPATYDFDWLSGPHPYGFALSGPGGMSVAEMEESIRDFLGQIDPGTGYLG